MLDKDGDGRADIKDLKGRYDVSQNPDFLAGVRTEDEILEDFLSSFERSNSRDGVVTPEEFVKYYNLIRYPFLCAVRCGTPLVGCLWVV